MSDNFQTLWLQDAINQHTTSRALQIVQETGRALPCKVKAVNGSLVTVDFECTFTVTQDGQASPITLPEVTLPIAMSQWLRVPVQIGDVGITQPADTFLGGISGQGSGVADLQTDYGNLSTLVFVPIAATSFPTSPDANKAWINGPNGALLSSADQSVSVSCDKTTGKITLTAGGIVLVLDKASGTVQIGGSGTSSGDAVIRASDLQSALNALATDLKTWANANFQGGTNSAAAPSVPTASGSAKTFST